MALQYHSDSVIASISCYIYFKSGPYYLYFLNSICSEKLLTFIKKKKKKAKSYKKKALNKDLAIISVLGKNAMNFNRRDLLHTKEIFIVYNL